MSKEEVKKKISNKEEAEKETSSKKTYTKKRKLKRIYWMVLLMFNQHLTIQLCQ